MLVTFNFSTRSNLSTFTSSPLVGRSVGQSICQSVIHVHITWERERMWINYQICEIISSLSHHQFVRITKSRNIPIWKQKHNKVKNKTHVNNYHFVRILYWHKSCSKMRAHYFISEGNCTYCTLECNIVGFAFNTT